MPYKEEEKQKEYLKKYRKGYNLNRRYGLPEEQYNLLLLETGGHCPICKLPFDKGNWASLDHCHKTKKIRGIICRKCNLGLGNFKEDPETVARALEWLKKA